MLQSSCETIVLCDTLGHTEIATVVHEPRGPHRHAEYYDYPLEVSRSITWSTFGGSTV
jgi:hypothetical protein